MKSQTIRFLRTTTLVAIGLGVHSLANAATLEIEITNLTQGITFTPFIVTTHQAPHQFFKTGTTASNSLQQMAEGGNIAGLESDAMAAGATVVANPNQGLLAPGMSVASFDIEASDGAMLSLASMLLPTNDGFAGIDSWAIPTEKGSYNIWVSAYDAGTEINNELIVAGAGGPGQIGIPGNPSGQGGTNGSGVTTTEENMTIHIHRGNLGDDDEMAGKSDLNNTVHRWLNPVLKVTVTVK